MPATKLRLYADTLRLIADARLATITDDVESRYALDDAWDEAVAFVLRQAPWRFALKTGLLLSAGTPLPNYAYSYALPTDELRIHSLFISGTDGREHPVDLREQGAAISTNSAALSIRYVSTDFADPELAGHPWPEHLAQAVAAYLAFLVVERVTGEKAAQGRFSELFNQLLGEAQRIDAVPEDRWLPFQRTGELLLGCRALLHEGFWRFALTDAAITTQGGVPARGFAYAFPTPTDRLHTQRLFVSTVDGQERPFDVREQGGTWSANRPTFNARYVSSALGIDPTRWDEPFKAALLAYLEAGQPAMPQPGRGQDQGQDQTPPWVKALMLAREACAEPPDPMLPHQFSGALQREVRRLLRQGYWRFAMVTAVPTVAPVAPEPGYSHAFKMPDDRVNTHALYLGAAGREMPFDVREHGQTWHTNVAAFTARYVSTLRGTDPTLWPEMFVAALAEALEPAPAQQPDHPAAPTADLLAEALAVECDPPHRWLGFQLSGEFARSQGAVLSEGYWVYRDPDGVMRGLKERQYSYLADQLDTPPSSPFPYRFPLPSDRLRSYALFVPWDGKRCPIAVAETGQDWSTDAQAFVAQYVSNEVLDATGWPDEIADAVHAHCVWKTAPTAEATRWAQEYALRLAAAQKLYSRPEDPWLRFQLSGAFRHAVEKLIEEGRWRFALRTVALQPSTDPIPADLSDGTASAGYSYRFIQPNDLLRPMRVYYGRGAAPYSDRVDIDYITEGGAFHANYSPLTVRYVSRMGLDATKWSAAFRDAVLAWLEYEEARADPAKTAVAAAKLKLYEDACERAEQLDEALDTPQIIRPGKFVRARLRQGVFDPAPDFIPGFPDSPY